VPEPGPPPLASTLSHLVTSLLQNLALRAGALGRGLRRVIRALRYLAPGRGAGEHIATGTQHFDPRHLHLGISRFSLRIAARQDLGGIVARRRTNYFFLLARLRDVAPPLFQELPAGVCPLFYPLIVSDKSSALLA